MKKILFTAQDPSSGNIVSVLVKKIKNTELKILGSKESKKIFIKEKISFLDVDQEDKIFNFEQIVEEFRPDLIVTGASVGDTIDRKAILLAREKKVPSVSILDFWVNYVERYSNLDNGDKLVFLPDYVFIPDKLAKEDMIKLGFPEEKLVITGNPYFDTFTQSTKKGDYILYISQTKPTLEKDNVEFNFEPRVLDDLLEFLSKGQKLVIRLHPKDNIKDFENYLKNKNREDIILDQDSNLDELIDESKIIIGISSIVLLQAALKKKIVISYIPNIDQSKDNFICKRLNICYSAYEKEEFLKEKFKTFIEKCPKSIINMILEDAVNFELLEHVLSQVDDYNQGNISYNDGINSGLEYIRKVNDLPDDFFIKQ